MNVTVDDAPFPLIDARELARNRAAAQSALTHTRRGREEDDVIKKQIADQRRARIALLAASNLPDDRAQAVRLAGIQERERTRDDRAQAATLEGRIEAARRTRDDRRGAPGAHGEQGEYTIDVVALSGGTMLMVDGDDTIAMVKNKFDAALLESGREPMNDMSLWHEDERLDEARTLRSYDIGAGAVIQALVVDEPGRVARAAGERGEADGGGKKSRRKKTKRRHKTGGKKSRKQRKRTTIKGGKRKRRRTRRRR